MKLGKLPPSEPHFPCGEWGWKTPPKQFEDQTPKEMMSGEVSYGLLLWCWGKEAAGEDKEDGQTRWCPGGLSSHGVKRGGKRSEGPCERGHTSHLARGGSESQVSLRWWWGVPPGENSMGVYVRRAGTASYNLAAFGDVSQALYPPVSGL